MFRKPVPLANQKVWDEITKEVKKSYKNACITYIDECIAPLPKERYENYKSTLEDPKEISVWHGTKEHLIDKICEEGFDPKYNKRSAYGKGVYFSSSLMISLDEEYASKDHEELNNVFLCRIVAKNFQRCEAEDTIIVDNVEDPKIFIARKSRQTLPIFVVGFYKSIS